MNFFMLESVGNKMTDECQINDIVLVKVMFSSKLNSSVVIKYEPVKLNFGYQIGNP